MNYLSEEDIKILEETDAIKHFRTVSVAHYKRCSSTKLDNLVADIYDKTTNEKISRNFSCNHCIYTLYEKAGKLYYASKEYYSKKTVEQPKITEVDNTPIEPKKRGRKPQNKQKTTN